MKKTFEELMKTKFDVVEHFGMMKKGYFFIMNTVPPVEYCADCQKHEWFEVDVKDERNLAALKEFVNEQDDPNGILMVGGTELWHDKSMQGGTRFNIVDPVKVDTHNGAKLLELALKLDVFADETEIVEDDQKADPSNMTYSQLLEYLETHPDAVIE